MAAVNGQLFCFFSFSTFFLPLQVDSLEFVLIAVPQVGWDYQEPQAGPVSYTNKPEKDSVSGAGRWLSSPLAEDLG